MVNWQSVVKTKEYYIVCKLSFLDPKRFDLLPS